MIYYVDVNARSKDLETKILLMFFKVKFLNPNKRIRLT
jgi:hypothetical protein